jgi:hypothetical protein
MSDTEEVVKEMRSTRKALAFYFRKLAVIEAKIDHFTEEENRRREEEKIRRRERVM